MKYNFEITGKKLPKNTAYKEFKPLPKNGAYYAHGIGKGKCIYIVHFL